MEDANKGVVWCVFLVNRCSRHRAEGIHSKWTAVVKTCMAQSLIAVSGYPVAGAMRDVHTSEHTHIHTVQQNCQTQVVDRDTYVKFDFGFLGAWLPMKFAKFQKLYKYYLWEGEEVTQHQLSICLAALLSKTKQHCRKK